VTRLEAKTHRPQLIARNGKPQARLTSLRPAERPRRLGVANSLITELFERG